MRTKSLFSHQSAMSRALHHHQFAEPIGKEFIEHAKSTRPQEARQI